MTENEKIVNNPALFINNSEKETAKAPRLIHIPSISLPKSGGAIKNIDDKFSVNPSSGTATYSVPLPFSTGRSGATPSMSLSYNSGGGNSVFGLGWNVDIPAIQRKLEKKLPEYLDSIDTDTFMFSGLEDLVPDLTNISGNKTRTRYRPRIEGNFARIEKIDEDGSTYWQVRSRDNVVSVFGKSEEARRYSPIAGEENKIFKWCLE